MYFYTEHQCQKVLDFVKSEMNSFIANLAPLGLTAIELIMLGNRQLQPTIAYRLLASPLTNSQLRVVEQCIWRDLSLFGKLPKFLLPKNKHTGRRDGSLSLVLFHIFLFIFMRTQIFNYSSGYLTGDGPKQSNHHVETALTRKRANWLQNAFVDSKKRWPSTREEAANAK